MKTVLRLAIALLTSLAAILMVSSASGQRLEREPSTVIFDYEVTNNYGVHFADEFERLGGVEALGYSASYRFRLADGFTYQLTQGVLLQWRPEVRKAYLGNTFEILEKAGFDEWLLDSKGVPLPIKEDGSGGDWNKARQIRLAWLTNEKIKAKFLANPNPEGTVSWSEDRSIELYGLPMSYPEKHGPFVSQRFQRVAFQLWVEEVEGMPTVGTVVRVLGGDLLKEACLIPQHALAPAERSTCAGRGYLSLLNTPNKSLLIPISSPYLIPPLSLNPLPPPPPPLRSNPPPSTSPPQNPPKQDPPPQQDPPQQDPPQQDPPQQDPTGPPKISIRSLESSMPLGGVQDPTIFVENISHSETYLVELVPSNNNVGFSVDTCAGRGIWVTVGPENTIAPVIDNAWARTSVMYACIAGEVTMTATLTQGDATLDTDTFTLTVTN